MIKKITSTRIFYGLLSLIFVFINYSKNSWIFFNSLGGLVLAKIGPEISGIIFFILLSIIYVKTFYKDLKIKIEKREWFTFLFLLIVILVYRYKQFFTYFYHDDFYLVLNRLGTAYSKYQWEPWLSSFPLWTWETIRSVFGYSILPYQIASIMSHFLLSIGVYFLSKYLSKNYYVATISSFLVLTTTISFEAFQWLIHPINFAWQGFFICFSLIALVWEIKKNKGTTIPYLSAFLMMPAFGAGIARIGFILPLISGVDFLTSIEYFNIKKVGKWTMNFISRQWIFYLMVFTFLLIRNLIGITGTKTEIVTTSLFKIYLYVIGISTFPVELFIAISKLTLSSIPPGTITIWFGFIFLVVLGIAVLVVKFKGKRFPLTLSVGLSWLIFSALYYTLFGPHLPATDNEISIASRTHHLAYLASVGPLMIWGYFLYQIIKFLKRLKRPFGIIAPVLLIVGLILLNYIWLSKQYDNFLELPKGVRVVRQQFFFDSYRKYIPANVGKVNIFYDDGALKRKDNYKPNEYYYWAFWDMNNVRIFYGDKELRDYLTGLNDRNFRDKEINSLYYIYTDYDDGLIEDNLSSLLRNTVYNPKFQSILTDDWKLYWGKKSGNVFLPEILNDKGSGVNYFRNPVIFVDQITFPSILTPKLNIRLNIQKIGAKRDYVDLRAGILAQLLNNWTLPSSDQMASLVKYYSDNPSQSVLAFKDLLNNVHVNDKMVCGQKTNDDGITFLIVWLGEPDSYYFGNKDKELLSGYLDRYYSVCYFPNLIGYKNMNIELPNLGSILRGVVIIPLTKFPVSLDIINSSLESPEILSK